MGQWLSRTIIAASLSAGLACAAWITEGYDAFRKGQFDSAGVNLYVSRKGIVQTVHRFDVNNDGYFDLIFNNTHDLVYVTPSYGYQFGRGLQGKSGKDGNFRARARSASWLQT